MKTAVIGLLAETGLHPGTESTVGVVDLPVAREGATEYPVIPGSGLKGALRDKAEQEWEDTVVKEVFGEPDGAGGVAVTDARLLLLPVRSLTGHYQWVTCPYLLERFQRNMALAQRSILLSKPEPDTGSAVAKGGKTLFLEELSFQVTADEGAINKIAEAVKILVCHQSVQARLADQIAVVSDKDFAYFARYGLPVNAHNVLNDETKTSENLWYEEIVPPDSLFYALLLARPGKDPALEKLRQLFESFPYLQVGGNETVGQGWCAVAWCGEEG